MDSQEATTFTLVLIVFVTLGIIITYFIIAILRQHRRTSKLQQAVVLAELTAIEKERARIAADLHDDVSPLLSVVKFQVDSVETVSDEDAGQLVQASNYIDDILHRIREISIDLMPSSLLQKGLFVAIHEFIDKVSEATGMTILFHYEDGLQIPQEQYANIYRIVQEVVQNSRKHARADKIEMLMEMKGNTLHLLIRDNGTGFDYEKISRTGQGIGLRSLNNRAEAFGGSMTVQSEAENGTALLFRIPLS